MQLETVKQRIEIVLPGTTVEVIARSSRGDDLQDVPLQTVEGSDFFTQDIFDALANGEADIAVHSLKDMSHEHFSGTNHFAVVDRDDVRDVAIFSPAILSRIESGNTIVIGTCSPRREEMATQFLQKALPQLNKEFRIATKPIRGNVDTRLRKLDAGEYDAIILATAGLNRLLPSAQDATSIRDLLSDKQMMLLPLIECVPAPCQGAIVAEAHPSNELAVSILRLIDDVELRNDCMQEKDFARQYGAGCLQRFGVTTIRYGNNKTIYAAGRDENEKVFTQWTGLPAMQDDVHIFSSTEHMGRFFSYQWNENVALMKEDVIYVSNYKAIEQPGIVQQLRGKKKVWAAGTKTWFELAKKGIWVNGSADAFGLEFLEPVFSMPLVTISKKEVAVVTNNQSVDVWTSKGWSTYGTYDLVGKQSPVVEEEIRNADLVFWTSYRQYLQYISILKPGVIHSCPFGETVAQFKSNGIDPIIFPNIKAFQQWRQTSIHSRSVA